MTGPSTTAGGLPQLCLTLTMRQQQGRLGPGPGVCTQKTNATLTGNASKCSLTDVGRYTYNDLGTVLDHPKHRIKDLSLLHPADLIAFQRSLLPDTQWMGYWHLAIVESINLNDQTIEVIHYQPVFDETYQEDKNRPPSKFRKGTIVSTRLTFADEQIWLVELDHTKCLPAEEVLKRARLRLQENAYNLLFNNCESFAFWAKTGSNSSAQSSTIASLAVQQTSRAFVKLAAKKAAEKVIKKRFLQSTLSQAGRLTRVTGLFSMVDAAMSAGFTLRDIMKAKKKLKEGQINRTEYRNAIKTLLAVRTGDVGCSIVGTLAGSALGGPPGAVIGATIGSAVGTVLGSATANAVVKNADE